MLLVRENTAGGGSSYELDQKVEEEMRYCPEQGTRTETVLVVLPFLISHSNCGVKLEGRAVRLFLTVL